MNPIPITRPLESQTLSRMSTGLAPCIRPNPNPNPNQAWPGVYGGCQERYLRQGLAARLSQPRVLELFGQLSVLNPHGGETMLYYTAYVYAGGMGGMNSTMNHGAKSERPSAANTDVILYVVVAVAVLVCLIAACMAVVFWFVAGDCQKEGLANEDELQGESNTDASVDDEVGRAGVEMQGAHTTGIGHKQLQIERAID